MIHIRQLQSKYSQIVKGIVSPLLVVCGDQIAISGIKSSDFIEKNVDKNRHFKNFVALHKKKHCDLYIITANKKEQGTN